MNLEFITSFDRVGTLPHRSYFIPFAPTDEVDECFGIINRHSSSRFISLDGEWQIRQYQRPDEVDLDSELTDTIDVPSCVQMRGYDMINYLNARYPIPF